MLSGGNQTDGNSLVNFLTPHKYSRLLLNDGAPIFKFDNFTLWVIPNVPCLYLGMDWTWAGGEGESKWGQAAPRVNHQGPYHHRTSNWSTGKERPNSYQTGEHTGYWIFKLYSYLSISLPVTENPVRFGLVVTKK